MALTAFLLSEAVAGARRRGSGCNVAPYEFATDNIVECSVEMDYVIMAEANNMAEMFMVTDEIMAEAAIRNPRALDTISESVFDTVKNGIKKFFDKIISVVRGIIDKLKAFIYKMTGKVSKWLDVMKKKIEDVKSNQTGYQNVKAETYPYDEKYILDDMHMAVDKLNRIWTAEIEGVSIRGLAATTKELVKKGYEGMEVEGVEEGKKAPAADKDNPKVKELEKVLKDATEGLEKFKKGFPKAVATALSCESATTLDAVWVACAKKARGGKSEKAAIQIGNKVDTMITALESISDSTDKLKKAYEEHLKDLEDFRSGLDEGDFKVTDENDKVPGNMKQLLNDGYSAVYKFITETTSMIENAMGSAKTKNLEYLQEMSSAYMSSLTTFANYKAPKKS